MARTPLAGRLEDLVAGHRSTRRDFIGAAASATAAAALWSPGAARAASTQRIAIVGGGLAGLTCAYRLQQAGVAADVYEASTRWGGRCWSLRDRFADGQVAERGGELIDNAHLAVKHLAQELRLNLDNLYQAMPNGSEPFYYFDGVPYTEAQTEDDLNGIYQKLHSDTIAASYPTTYTTSTTRGRQLDAMTLYQWIEESVPGGHGSKLGKLLDVAYNIEFGAETNQQSALNLIYLLGYVGQGQLRMFGKSNEKFHIRGGNDQLVSGMVAALPAARLHTGKEMTAVRRSGAAYTLTFADGSTVTADRVVMALPFTILRSCDYSGAGFRTVKQQAIQELGMGTNTKLNVGFKTRLWNQLGSTGETYADTGYQNTWDVSRAQPGTSGILVDYTGGTIGASFGSGTATSRAKQFLGQIEPVLPGITKQWAGTAHLQYWTGYQWTKGSYSYYRPGQYTRFGGSEGEPEGAVHFCGEHTTQDFQGYLNGAVDTGERVASEVLDALR